MLPLQLSENENKKKILPSVIQSVISDKNKNQETTKTHTHNKRWIQIIIISNFKLV